MAKATTTIRQRLTNQAEYAAYFAANQSLFNRVVAFYFEVIAAHEGVLDLWSEPILPDTRGSQLPAQSGQGKYTATLADIKPSCSFLAMRLTSASLRGL